ncbi:fibronectin type III domain-containing protein, partial [Candidatus Peregrinibacteria bacterium]|nr:fibronectin type III domain-containing protein [Candidatus Peregrinibacteria bacterium]
VTGVSADADKEKVILSWEANTGVIDHYRIYYGTDQYKLDEMVDTPDNATSFSVTELTGGVKYFFAMVAVDDLGLESEEQSAVVSAIPLGVVYPDPVTGVSAKPEYGKVTLSWLASSDDTYIDHYRVYYGTVADNLSQTADTFNGALQWYIPELTPGIPYYFAVTAVDSDGYESQTKSAVIVSAPLTAPLPGQTPETGPAADLLIVLSLIGAEAYVLRKYFGFRAEYLRQKNVIATPSHSDFYRLSS